MLLLKSVDYGRMAEILVQRAASHDEFTRLTAITWVSRVGLYVDIERGRFQSRKEEKNLDNGFFPLSIYLSML